MLGRIVTSLDKKQNTLLVNVFHFSDDGAVKIIQLDKETTLSNGISFDIPSVSDEKTHFVLFQLKKDMVLSNEKKRNKIAEKVAKHFGKTSTRLSGEYYLGLQQEKQLSSGISLKLWNCI